MRSGRSVRHRTPSLVDTFDPPTIATSGRAGRASALPSASSSAQRSGPAHAVGAKRATPWVEAWARWAVPNASITYTSHSAAMRRASASSSAFSPSRKRTFSQSTISPGSTSRPSSQSSASRTWRPSSSPRRRATGASECRGSGLPSFGRPRCDITITRAPARAACCNVGTAARSRASPRGGGCDIAVLDGDVEVLADEHSASREVQIGHGEDVHVASCNSRQVKGSTLGYRAHVQPAVQSSVYCLRIIGHLRLPTVS